MPIRDTNFYPTISAGRAQGTRNALLERELAHENRVRNLLAETVMPEGTPAERERAFDMLMAEDPATAAQVVNVETMRDARETRQRQQEASEGYAMASYVLESSKPEVALAVLDDDGAVRGLATQMGIEWPEGGYPSPEAARSIAGMLQARYAKTAGVRDEPADIRTMRALGYSLTPEGFRQYQQDHATASGEELDRVLAMLQISGEQARQAREQSEAAREARERAQERQIEQGSIETALGQTAKIAAYTQQLEGTLLQAGVPFSGLRRELAGILTGGAALFGREIPELEQAKSRFDSLNKEMSDQLLRLMSAANLGQTTNDKLAAMRESLAQPETSPAAILRIQANAAETLLNQAQAKEFEITGREQYRRSITELHALADQLEAGEDVDAEGETANGGGRGPGAVIDAATATASDIVNMTGDQLAEIDFRQLGERAQQTAARRFDELARAARSAGDQAGQQAATRYERLAAAARSAGLKASEIGQMSLEQLQRLDISALSDEAISAAERRWEALNAGEQ